MTQPDPSHQQSIKGNDNRTAQGDGSVSNQGDNNQAIQGDGNQTTKGDNSPIVNITLPGSDEKPPSPNNLPQSQPIAFVGRDRELQQLHQQLQTPQTVALVGMGGLGKTELARQYARRYASEYPGGVC